MPPVQEIFGVEQFREVVNARGASVIMFSAVWCGPCKTIAKDLDMVAYQLSDVRFVKVDVDNNPDITMRCNITALPTFMLVKGGEQLGFHLGANLKDLQKKIKETFKP
jgi:thioredoxin 1